MIVYELVNGRPVGLYQTLDGAKRAAAAILDSYHEFDNDHDVEEIRYDAGWEMLRETVGPGRREIGEPKPTMVYGTASRFIIREREVHP